MGWLRWVRAAAAILLVAALNAGFPARAEQHAALDTKALASWTVPTDNPRVYKWYFVDVELRERPLEGDGRGEAYLARGRCRVNERGGAWRMICSGVGPGGFPYEFAADPVGSSASFRAKKRSLRTAIDWTSSPEDTDLYESGELCSRGKESGEGRGGGLYHRASATGRMFGRRLATQSKYDYAAIFRGAMVTECDSFEVSPRYTEPCMSL
jgi:hypothetical protein